MIAIEWLTTRTLPFRIVTVQSRARLPGAIVLVCLAILTGMALLRGIPATPVDAASRDLFDELYARGQKQNAGLKTLTASFTESSTAALLAKPLIERGTVYVERPGRVALRYTDPDARVVIIDGGRLTVSWPSAKIQNVKDIGAAQRRVQKYFIDSSADELRGHFTVSAQAAEDRPGTYLITMVPKRKQIQEGMTKLELWLDRTSLLLAAMRMTFPSGDTKTMAFADIKPNAPIDPEVFKPTP